MTDAGSASDPLAGLAPWVLASASPRRSAILGRLGFRFTVHAPDVDETPPPGLPPERIAVELALRKARHVARSVPDGTVLAADTIVVARGLLLGKPEHAAEARAMLESLSATTHEVLTGFALLHPRSGVEHAEADVTRVTMRPLAAAEIRDYVASGESFGKAGGYAIQEHADRFVTRLDGSFDNVVGFPTERFLASLPDFARRVAARQGAR